MHRFLLFSVTVLMVSCSATKSSVSPEPSTLSKPTLNATHEVEIGVSLVSKENGLTFDAIEITKAFTIQLGHTNKTIEAGTLFINDYTAKDIDLHSPTSDDTFGIAIPTTADTPLVYTSRDDDGIYATGYSAFGLNFIKPKDKIEYSPKKVTAKDTKFFRQEFIYNGRVGNALKFIYREYVNEHARPAFTQDVQYDVSENKTIGFRGLRIEIIEATNTKIKYIVLNYFDN